MKVRIKPTENLERLKANLEKRVNSIEEENGELLVETDNPSKLEKVPGIKSIEFEGEKRQGIKGRPVEEPVYARLESKEDAVKCLVATVKGYDLRILNSDREWDIRQLKRYNPDIKHLKLDQPVKELKIEKTVSDIEGLKKIDIEVPEKEDEIEEVYREMLT